MPDGGPEFTGLYAASPDFFGHTFQVRMKERLLRDPVHGLIPIDENSPRGRLITALIDTAEMQRLRRIRQLGLACHAFQGAEHTRFAHSIGAFHLTGRILEQLGKMYTIDAELAFFASIAALLHDIGHGPFSHLSERAMGVHHETWTVRIIQDWDTEVGAVLSGYSRNLPSIIESILIGMAKPGYLSSLVNGELDADRLDYLMRDSLMTGVKYGVFDLDRLIHVMRISPEGDKILIDRSGLAPVEKYIQARHHMHRQVYRHKTVIAAEAMLEAALRRARDLMAEAGAGMGMGGGAAGGAAGSGALEISPLLARALTSVDELTVADYLQLDDIEVAHHIKLWARGADPVLRELAGGLLNRRLFKTLEIDPDAPGLPAMMDAAAAEVRAAGLDPRYHLIRVDSTDTPYRPYEANAEKITHQILMDDGKGRGVDVAEVSPTIRAYTQSTYRANRLVFPEKAGEINLRTKLKSIFNADG